MEAEQALAKLCACCSNAYVYILLPYFAPEQVVLKRTRGKHRYNAAPPPRFWCPLKSPEPMHASSGV